MSNKVYIYIYLNTVVFILFNKKILPCAVSKMSIKINNKIS
jgi:hypothetical protein